jgi:hypothetical protein
MKRAVLLSILAAVSFVLMFSTISFGQEKLKVTKVTDVSYPAKSKKEPVEVYIQTKPAKEYEVIAEISGSFTGEPKEVLEAKARKAGGDAVIVNDFSFNIESQKGQMGVQQKSRPASISPTYTPGYSYKVYTVKGVIVKYKNPQ